MLDEKISWRTTRVEEGYSGTLRQPRIAPLTSYFLEWFNYSFDREHVSKKKC